MAKSIIEPLTPLTPNLLTATETEQVRNPAKVK